MRRENSPDISCQYKYCLSISAADLLEDPKDRSDTKKIDGEEGLRQHSGADSEK